MQIPGRVDLYNVAVFFHVATAPLAFGVVLAWPVALRGAAARPGPEPQSVYALGVLAHRRLVTPAMTIVLIAGVYLASARWSFSATWINMSMTL